MLISSMHARVEWVLAGCIVVPLGVALFYLQELLEYVVYYYVAILAFIILIITTNTTLVLCNTSSRLHNTNVIIYYNIDPNTLPTIP